MSFHLKSHSASTWVTPVKRSQTPEEKHSKDFHCAFKTPGGQQDKTGCFKQLPGVFVRH